MTRQRRVLALLVALLVLMLGGAGMLLHWGLTDSASAPSLGDDAWGARANNCEPQMPQGASEVDPGAKARTASALDRRPPAKRAAPLDPVETTSAVHTTPAAAKPSAPAARSMTAVGRFSVVGDGLSRTGDAFGEQVAIEGNIAVVAAPGFRRDFVGCGAVFVYERAVDGWKLTQRLDSPRPDVGGFAWRVGVAQGRVLVFGGNRLGVNEWVFRTYGRSAEGTWSVESETGFDWNLTNVDAVVARETIATGCADVLIYRHAESGWGQAERVRSRDSFGMSHAAGSWISIGGDTVAYYSSEQTRNRAALFRESEGRFRYEQTIDLSPQTSVHGAVACGGTALVCAGGGPLTIDERGSAGWTRTVSSSPGVSVSGVVGYRPVAADGNLVVIASASERFVVLERRADGWYRADLAAVAGSDSRLRNAFGNCASVAVSGRAVVVGTRWDGLGGRAAFFDVTDADLSSAVKLVSVTR